MPHAAPQDIQLIGSEIALLWPDGREDYLPMEYLRASSPSAETRGETDLFGRRIGGDDRQEYPGVRAEGFEWVGTYAVRFLFSDGHNTGLYSYEYLRQLGDAVRHD